jgi:hypothetical protein
MKRLAGVALVLGGVGLVLLGLLFLVGAAGRAGRYLVGVVSLTLGGTVAGLGARLVKEAAAASPERLRAEILELARRRSGEVSEAEVGAELGTRAAGAPAVLAALEGERLCVRRSREGATYFVFESLQPRLVVRRCEYCNAELPVSGNVTSCPTCGGSVKTQVESRSLSGGDAYRMDD